MDMKQEKSSSKYLKVHQKHRLKCEGGFETATTLAIVSPQITVSLTHKYQKVDELFGPQINKVLLLLAPPLYSKQCATLTAETFQMY